MKPDEATGNALDGRRRLWAAGVAAGLLVLLAAARWLEPDARGRGTHQGFGLPPCTFRVIFGRRCPTCGMTTSWSHLVRGELPSAFRANATGTACGMIAAAAAVWLLAGAVRGRWLGVVPNASAGAWLAAALVLAALVEWIVRLWAG